jgi:hypothetical protein
VADSEIVGAFYSRWDSGRDCRAVLSVSAAGHVRVDLRYWQIGRPVPTRQGITVAQADWPAFAELIAVVTDGLRSLSLVAPNTAAEDSHLDTGSFHRLNGLRRA